jgi:quercetin dioxygenase-like cupin family protein
MSVKTTVALCPYALAAGEGRPLAWFGANITLKASAPDIGVVEAVLSPGEEPPVHIHSNEDEWMYVLEGEMTFHVGAENYFARTGGFVSFPRGIPHTFTVESPKARFLVTNTPGGFERMFELGPKTEEEAVRAMTAFGMEIVGPHPRKSKPPVATGAVTER